MRSNTSRAIAGLAVVALAVILFVVLQGGDDEDETPSSPPTAQPAEPSDNGDQPADEPDPAEPTPPFEPVEQTIRIQDGAPVGGVAEIEAAAGETVAFQVVSDEPGDVHIHGYEVEKAVQPNKPLLVSFGADIEGAFEVELHGEAGEFQIAELSVSPG